MFEAKNPLPIILGFIAITAIVITSIAGLNLLVYAFLNDNSSEIKATTGPSDLFTRVEN